MNIIHKDFRQFIIDYLPNDTSNLDVQWSNTLMHYICDKKISTNDLMRIEDKFQTKNEIEEELDRIHSRLFTLALGAYCGVDEPIRITDKCYWDITRYCGKFPIGIMRDKENDLLVINAHVDNEEGNDFVYEVVGNVNDDVMNHFNGLFKKVMRRGEIHHDIATHDRMQYLKEQGLDLRFVRPAKEQANTNLLMCGADMSKVVAAMLKHFYYDNLGGNTTMLDCIDYMAENDALEYGLTELHNIYYSRVSTFLYNSFTGMRLGTPWNGRAEVNGGYIVVKRDGEVVAYHSTIADEFKDFLVHRLTMESPSHKRHRDMVIEKIDGRYYLKLGLQLRFGLSGSRAS